MQINELLRILTVSIELAKKVSFSEVKENHIQLLHGGVNHWYLSFDTRAQVQVYDSLRTNISSSVTKQRLKALYKSLISKDGKVTITMVPAQMQKDGKNCRLFAIAFPKQASVAVNQVTIFLISELNMT